MSDNLPLTVNRKQFHFLLNKFLAEHRLQEKWFSTSFNYKLTDGSRRGTYIKYGILGDKENYNEFLYKCIDIYIGETIENKWYYYESIRSFFRFIPSGGCDGLEWHSFWETYSNLWEKITYNVKYKKDG